MLRHLHSFPGLIAGLFIAVLALTGSILSIDPALGRAVSSQPVMSVAALATAIIDHFPEAERIVRKPSGQIVVYAFAGDTPFADIVDPTTGVGIAAYAPSGFTRWITDLHRAFLLGDTGRAVAGVGAAITITMALSGAVLLAARMGGWSAILGRARGTGRQRLHVQIGRFAVAGLLLSALTGAYMSLTTFGFIPDGMDAEPAFPASVNGGPPIAVGDIPILQQTDLSALRELALPYATDPTDVFTLTTSTGMGYIDQSTGQMLDWLDNGPARQVYEFVFMLHTGQGLWWLALILGAGALMVPVLAVSGALVWWARRGGQPRIVGNVSAQAADTIILVGSEGNSTWGFAQTLHAALTAQGHAVHAAPMNSFASAYRRAKRMFILTATYGDGDAPASAAGFLARLGAVKDPGCAVAVLGFGDRQFPQFCQFAADVADAIKGKGWPALLPLETIDRQSAQDFARWGQAVGVALGAPLLLTHVAKQPPTIRLKLLSRVDYGAEWQSPAAVLRFVADETGTGLRGVWRRWRGLPGFEPGDLAGILPPGSTMPRFYSLATARSDGVLEFCVRKQPGGLCSGALFALQPGDTIQGFVKPNPEFRPMRGHKPVILIGAGTGIGPLAGFIRHNRKRRPMHLYFGARDPQSDFLYQPDLQGWTTDNRLTRLITAFSRVTKRAYVQDRLRDDQEALRKLIAIGAQIIVCGGREMGHGVALALDEILAPLELSAAKMRAAGRYIEDVY